MAKSKSKLLRASRNMPPLYHSIPDEEFDIRKARTLWWLLKQPDILNWIWNHLKQSGDLIYNSKTGKWQGVDFIPDED